MRSPHADAARNLIVTLNRLKITNIQKYSDLKCGIEWHKDFNRRIAQIVARMYENT